ncbi:DUF4232 domain-containing protein [Streptomyces sp. NBC_00448]|uniref:DUF4232 domain-containing protein n=1 Tax=Streptomyces sp. NBC_00448 TaxID=2903652 RepID=UPI002E22571C
MRKASQLGTLAVGMAALAVAVTGCGNQSGDGGTGSTGTPPTTAPRVSAAATLEPDGTVPWVDEPATDADFRAPTTAPAPVTGPTCHASQLTGVLTRWIHKSTNGEVNDPIMDASLFGYAVLTNTSHTACKLQGIPKLRLAAGGTTVPLPHSGSRSRPAVGLPPGGTANFRIDWDGPYCPTQHGTYTLDADLPGAGDVAVRLVDQTVPGCAHDDLHPQVTSFLSPGPLSDGDGNTDPRPVISTLSTLTARATDVPKSVRLGRPVDFTVTLNNPTGEAVSLAGRPGFTLQVLCTGTQGREGLNNGGKSYLLNNRAVHSVPAHGSVRFAVRATIPRASSFPGPNLYVNWRMFTRGLPSGLPFVSLTLPTGT